jgi:hypothetical protein
MSVSAATVSVGGRVTNTSGSGLSGVIVSIDGGSLSAPMYTRTSPFGYYTFEGIPAGLTYIVTVSSKQYTFSPPSRIIDVQDSVSNADFVSQE